MGRVLLIWPARAASLGRVLFGPGRAGWAGFYSGRGPGFMWAGGRAAGRAGPGFMHSLNSSITVSIKSVMIHYFKIRKLVAGKKMK